MNVTYINPFITSTIGAFKTMLNVDAVPGTPKLKGRPFPSFDISGIIGLTGDAQGSIAISFSKAMALSLVSTMLGTPVKIVGPELSDGIGELANIIAGSAKQHLVNFNLSISLPNVVIGKDHTLSGQSSTPTILVPFTSSLGSFIMEINLKTNGAPASGTKGGSVK